MMLFTIFFKSLQQISHFQWRVVYRAVNGDLHFRLLDHSSSNPSLSEMSPDSVAKNLQLSVVKLKQVLSARCLNYSPAMFAPPQASSMPAPPPVASASIENRV